MSFSISPGAGMKYTSVPTNEKAADLEANQEADEKQTTGNNTSKTILRRAAAVLTTTALGFHVANNYPTALPQKEQVRVDGGPMFASSEGQGSLLDVTGSDVPPVASTQDDQAVVNASRLLDIDDIIIASLNVNFSTKEAVASEDVPDFGAASEVQAVSAKDLPGLDFGDFAINQGFIDLVEAEEKQATITPVSFTQGESVINASRLSGIDEIIKAASHFDSPKSEEVALHV